MSKVLIDLYERALKASWPEGAKGEASEPWNEARILQQEPAADCGLEVVGYIVEHGMLVNGTTHPQLHESLVRKSDADARIAELEAQLAALKAQEPVGETCRAHQAGVIFYTWKPYPKDGTKLYAAPVAKQEVVMPPAPYCPELREENLTDYEIGELQGRCYMWEEVKRLNGGGK